MPDPATVQKEGCRRKRLHADTEPSEEREAGFAESKGSPACSEDEGEEEQTPRVKRDTAVVRPDKRVKKG